ncbi:conserved Plasmodium protein, unknown function [Plasmodium ovale]|uniref:Uncharacterized protein n=1 Tax=Plasmodium ovale TaxID=36330 RepID=A0A1D3U7I7_PLAOA|nr:conserved Plasmodium protein, unknown function [Plasmodium ovale]
MKRDQGKEEVKECCENYPNFNEDAKNWFYSKIGRNKMMHMQQKYQTFLKSYEDRKKNVTEKYNIKKYLSFLTNFLILFFVTFDFFYNIMKIIFKKVFSFYHNPLHSIQNTKHFLKKNVIYFTKTVNKYKELLLKSILFVLREKKKIVKEVKNICSFLFKLSNFYFFKLLETVYQYLHFRYCDIFRSNKIFKVFT